MRLFLLLLSTAVALVVIGAVMDGRRCLISIGVLLLLAAVMYLLVRSTSRSGRRPVH